jgi:hypothetical protein
MKAVKRKTEARTKDDHDRREAKRRALHETIWSVFPKSFELSSRDAERIPWDDTLSQEVSKCSTVSG